LPFGKKKTEEYDLTAINATPFGLFFGENDDQCPRSTVDQVKEDLGDMVKAFKVYPELDHTFMIMYNTEEFKQDILDFFAPDHSGDSDLPDFIQ